MRRNFLLTFLIFLSMAASAQLRSPEQFLGYPVGSRFTPHWKVVDYFRHVAEVSPSTVKMQQYGESYEGRPLLVSFVSSASNMSSLENIRANNMALAMQGGTTNTSNAPAIVWLSYNVHGNEASSTEAAMLTLYALADPSNTKARQWLENTVVIIDPCLNPDGRDRYVNWFNTVVGKNANPSLDAREHYEPWPNGRTNHYNFDLNRDWAWQTQVETQQRIALYNKWLPHVHVDFHEQYINNPYYFAPAAQPFHEVITPWQRDFQVTIGKNHARYFDEKGWLYFTKEYFDLLYPSYGDTYPTYNGSIGMTYEQAGHGMGGLTVKTSNGDTLTLYDRALHHFTTSLSTIEVASQNQSKLVSEFNRFFSEASRNGSGEYKTFIIKNNAEDAEKVTALLSLLDKNNIRHSLARSGNARGYNFHTGRVESFPVSGNDILVSTVQPKGALVKVLFEPQPVLVDSATYDITAWALPYAYGLRAYAVEDKLQATGNSYAALQVKNPALDPYGYVIRWNGLQTVKLLSQLLQEGIRLRYNEQPFETAGQRFERGAIIILKTSNQYFPGLWSKVRSLADQNNVQLTAVSTGFVDRGMDFGSSSVATMKAPRIALLTGEGIDGNAAGEIWHYFERDIDYPVTLVNAEDAAYLNFSNYDVIILPDGNYKFLADKEKAEKLRSWISGGGKLIALERAVSQLSKLEWSVKAKKDENNAAGPYDAVKRYEDREREGISSFTPGSIFKVELDNSHPLAFGLGEHYYTLKRDASIYEFIKNGGWNVGILRKEKQLAGFVGSELNKRLQDGLLFGTQNIGSGTVVYLVDDVLFRGFWENGKLLFSNAVFLVR